MATTAAEMGMMGESERAAAMDIYDMIKCIKDPERPETLEELEVVTEDSVVVRELVNRGELELHVTITFTPTVPHCSLATLIGLCLRVKLERNIQHHFKLDIQVLEGTHSIEADVNKQINDKERVSAAMENADLVSLVEECLKDS